MADDVKLEILTADMGGWVRVYLGEGESNQDLATYLSHTLSSWSRDHPHLRIRFAFPVNRFGSTVELHAWYDQVQFADESSLTRSSKTT